MLGRHLGPEASIQAAPAAPALESPNSAAFLPSSIFASDIRRECGRKCVPTVPPPLPVCSGDNPHATTEISATSRPSAESGLIIILLSTLALIAGSVAADGGNQRARHVTSVFLTPAAVMASSSWGLTGTAGESALVQQAPRELAAAECTVNVEIVCWGCCVGAMVTAPGAALRNSGDESLSGKNCKCQDKFLFEDPADATGVNDVQEKAMGNGDALHKVHGGADLGPFCNIAIGRPFRDAGGDVVSSSSEAADNEKAKLWSALDLEEGKSSIHETTIANHANREALEAEWTRRALGEHASIASFGAFAIDLMSNQAPPDLIQDSLTAAQDELRHAKVSFEMASLLAGKAIEPTPLPASTLEFQKDLASLALGTAREGCMEETLSAIEMAVAYDEYQASDEKDSVMSLLMDATRTIALEEGNHSALAWRTIAWVCRIDRDACSVVERELLNASNLVDAGQHRFAHSQGARDAWNCLWSALLPVVLGYEAEKIRSLQCSDAGVEALQSLLVQQIKAQVTNEKASSMM